MSCCAESAENLFLLEFLVDSLELAPQCECASPPGETCVAFTFLDNAPLEICEEDFSPGMKYGQDTARLKSGKSCLFSLRMDQINYLTNVFDVTITVIRKMQPGWLPEKILVGTAVISIANLFTEMIQSIHALTAPESPTSKTLKDIFDILNVEGTLVGKIGVYIRMSCFGKLIVTQFQMNFEDKSVLFKDKEGKSLYRYKKAPKGCEHKIDDVGALESNCDDQCPFKPCPEIETPPTCPSACPGVDVAVTCEQVKAPCIECEGKKEPPCIINPMGMGMGMGYGMGMPGMPMGCMPPLPIPTGAQPCYPQNVPPCLECGMIPDAPCGQPGMMNSYGMPGMMGMGMMPGMGGPVQEQCSPSCTGLTGPTGPSPPPPGNYQEIGATLGTNTLTIRVHKNKQIEPVPTENDPNSPSNDNNSCVCCPGAAAERKKRSENQKAQPPQIPTQAYNMGLGLPQGDARVPFALKMGCAGQGAGAGGIGGKNVTVHPPVSVAADGTQFTEISDPNKDLFILRIGKKSEGVDKKNNLELELCTPKAPDYKPLPKTETRDTQFDETDVPLSSLDGSRAKKAGKSAKKGKKGKK